MTEQRITDFWNEHALDYRSGKISEFGLMERTAKHFYNLALEEVKVAVVRRINVIPKDASGHKAICHLSAIKDFINELSK